MGTNEIFHEVSLFPDKEGLKIKHDSYLVEIEKGQQKKIIMTDLALSLWGCHSILHTYGKIL